MAFLRLRGLLAPYGIIAALVAFFGNVDPRCWYLECRTIISFIWRNLRISQRKLGCLQEAALLDFGTLGKTLHAGA